MLHRRVAAVSSRVATRCHQIRTKPAIHQSISTSEMPALASHSTLQTVVDFDRSPSGAALRAPRAPAVRTDVFRPFMLPGEDAQEGPGPRAAKRARPGRPMSFYVGGAA